MCAMISRACQEFYDAHWPSAWLHPRLIDLTALLHPLILDQRATPQPRDIAGSRLILGGHAAASVRANRTTSVHPYTSIYLYVLRVGTEYPPGLAGTFMVGSHLSATLTRARLQKAVISCRHRKPSAVIATHKRDPATNATQAGREATTPTNCRIIQYRSKCYPHLLASHQMSASSVEADGVEAWCAPA